MNLGDFNPTLTETFQLAHDGGVASLGVTGLAPVQAQPAVSAPAFDPMTP